MPKGSALGYGLIGGGAVLGLLGIAWLFTGGVEAGGFVLGLMLTAILSLPLIGGGMFVLSQQPAEAAQQKLVTGKRRVLDSDRLFRAELAAEIRQLAARPELATLRLPEIAEDLERPSYDRAEWFDAVNLTDADVETLRRYDDLVWQRVRALGRGPADPARAAQEVEDSLDQRRDLLLRGRRAAAIAPSDLLRSGQAQTGENVLIALKLRDAVTYEGDDYIVEGVASYFDSGRTWKLAVLEAVADSALKRWVYVSAGALTIGLLTEDPTLTVADGLATVADAQLPTIEYGTATVDVESQRGRAQGQLVTYSIFRSADRLAVTEQWPDAHTSSYSGTAVRASDFQVWPSEAVPTA